MYTDEKQKVIKTKSGVRQSPSAEVTSIEVRIQHKTKGKLEQLLKQANKERLGKRVKVDDLVWFALALITDQHLADICSKTLSNKDRMELLYRKLAKDKRGFTRDEFFGLLLEGKVMI